MKGVELRACDAGSTEHASRVQSADREGDGRRGRQRRGLWDWDWDYYYETMSCNKQACGPEWGNGTTE